MEGATVRRVSDTQRTMNVRDFVRGGYREDAGPVIVVNGSGVAGVWYPGTSALGLTPTPVMRPTPRPFTPVPKPGRKR